jgi:WD40 repeat protein
MINETGRLPPQVPAPPWWRRAIDFVFGYDFFISYAHDDGTVYPEKLLTRLTALGYRVFLDRVGYVAGDDLHSGTRRRVTTSRYMIVIARPEAMASDWVREEIGVCLSAKRTPIIVDILRTFENLNPTHPLKALLANRLAIRETLRSKDGEPSDEAVADLDSSFAAYRQETLRFSIGAAAIVVLAAALMTASFQLVRAERNRLRTEAATRRAVSLQLAAESRSHAADPLLRVRLAAGGVAIGERNNEPVPGEAEQALRDALANAGGTILGVDHDERRAATAISPDGRWLATVIGEKTIEVRDLHAATPATIVWTLRDHPGSVTNVRIARDGRWLAAGRWPDQNAYREKHWLRVWDLSGREPVPVLFDDGEFSVVSFDLNGGRVATSQSATGTRLWTIDGPKPAAARLLTKRRARDVAFTTDKIAAIVGGVVRLWPSNGTEQDDGLELRTPKPVDDIVWVPVRGWLVGVAAGEAYVWTRAEAGQRPIVISMPSGDPVDPMFSADGRWLAASGRFNGFVIVDFDRDPFRVTTAAADHGPVIAMAFSPNSSLLATSGSDKPRQMFELKFTRPETSAYLWRLDVRDPWAAPIELPHSQTVHDLAFSRDSRWLLSASGSTLNRWSPRWARTVDEGLRSGRELADLATIPESATTDEKMASAAEFGFFDTGGKDAVGPQSVGLAHETSVSTLLVGDRHVVTQGQTGPPQLWAIDAMHWGKGPYLLPHLPGGPTVAGIALSPDGSRLLHVVGVTLYLTPIGATTLGRQLGKIGIENEIEKAVFSPDSRSLVLEEEGGRVRLWDLKAPPGSEPILLRDEGSKLGAIRWSPDSRSVVLLQNFAKSRVIRIEPSIDSTDIPPADAVAFSHDSQFLAVGSRDKTIRLWSLKAAALDVTTAIVRQNPDPVAKLAFAAEGRWLVATGWTPDRSTRPGVCLWKLEPLANQCIDLGLHEWDVDAVLSANTRLVAARTGLGEIKLVNLDKPVRAGTRIREGGQFTLGRRVTFSPDRRWFLTVAGEEGELFDVDCVVQRCRFPVFGALAPTIGQRYPIMSAQFDPMSRWLVLGTQDTVVMYPLIENVGLGAPIRPFGDIELRSYLVEISNDGRWLVAVSDTQGVVAVPLPRAALLHAALETAGEIQGDELSRFNIVVPPPSSPPMWWPLVTAFDRLKMMFGDFGRSFRGIERGIARLAVK